MPVDTLSRNLRDGEITVSDGATSPASITLACDIGDLRWTITRNRMTIRDRGRLCHRRNGDEEVTRLSYSTRWTQLIGRTVTSGDSVQFYELVEDEGENFQSTAADGESFSLKHEFVVLGPANGTLTDEKIAFAKVAMTSLSPQEGDEANTISFEGEDFATAPTITRVSTSF